MSRARKRRAGDEVHPRGFHRIRHYGLLTNHRRGNALGHARELLNCEAPPPANHSTAAHDPEPTVICPVCGAPMLVIEQVLHGHAARAPPFVTGPPMRSLIMTPLSFVLSVQLPPAAAGGIALASDGTRKSVARGSTRTSEWGKFARRQAQEISRSRGNTGGTPPSFATLIEPAPSN